MYSNPFGADDPDTQIIVEPSPIHRTVRLTSRCGVIVCGALSASILCRLLPALQPLYAVAVGVGVIALLSALALSRKPETRLFALIMGALCGGGLLLGWWDWLWFVFSDLSGTSVIYQLLIVTGVTVFVASLQKALQAAKEDSYEP